MLEAFVLGFWAVWSSDRDIYALTESLSFMILVIIIRGFMAFALPEVNMVWGVAMLIQWIYVAVVLTVVNRVSAGFAVTLLLAALSAVGFYWLGGNAERLVTPLLA